MMLLTFLCITKNLIYRVIEIEKFNSTKQNKKDSCAISGKRDKKTR